MKEFEIGRMAELNCVTKKALRLYQKMGLLEPVRVDEENGYRYYSYDQCSTIDMIQQLQSLGVSLAEIKELLDSHDTANLAELLKVHQVAIDEEILRLSIARQNASQLLESYRIFLDKPILDKVIIENIDERRILSFDIFNPDAAILTDDAPEFLDEWELNLRLTKRYMLDNNLPLSLFHRVGCHIAKENLMKRNFTFDSSFILVDDASLAEKYQAQTIPAGRFLTLYKGRYSEKSHRSAELEGINTLLDYAEEHDLEIIGDYYGVIIAETPAFLYEGRDMLFKLEIPVALNK